MKHTMSDLYQMQGMPLEAKVEMTKRRVREWVDHYGEDSVFVSFSGGKDSTALLDIVRSEYPSIKAVFVDTGLEYPEIREFVKNFDNVVWLKPNTTFKKVIEKYGYPVISKQVSKRVYEWRNAIKKGRDVTKTTAYREFTGNRVFTRDGYTESKRSIHNKEKWMFLVEAPFPISHRCCDAFKKNTFHRYQKETRSVPITAQMAGESTNRANMWLTHGCNAFDSPDPKSNPMSFWTENDVLQYVKQRELEICSVYGDIVEEGEIAGQMTWDDYCGYDTGKKTYTTTECKRTGCMYCAFGCHLEKPGEGRFERMRTTHPKLYDYIMRPKEQGGLNYKAIIDWMNENGGLHIRY